MSKDGHIEEKTTGVILETPEEEDAFNLCQMPYIEPEKRTIQVFRTLQAEASP